VKQQKEMNVTSDHRRNAVLKKWQQFIMHP